MTLAQSQFFFKNRFSMFSMIQLNHVLLYYELQQTNRRENLSTNQANEINWRIALPTKESQTGAIFRMIISLNTQANKPFSNHFLLFSTQFSVLTVKVLIEIIWLRSQSTPTWMFSVNESDSTMRSARPRLVRPTLRTSAWPAATALSMSLSLNWRLLVPPRSL